MSRFAHRAHELEELLLAGTLPLREIRGAAVVDESGLVLVSSLKARGLEEGLAAVAGATLASLVRAQAEFQLGSLQYFHLAGNQRQLFLVPIIDSIHLLAVVEAGATAGTVVTHLLALARDIAGATRG